MKLIWNYKKIPEGIVLIHKNAASLCNLENYDKITSTLAELKPNPSMIFISETRVLESKEKEQLDKIRIEGYKFVYDSSPSNAGGTALYVSDNLKFIERPDIKFDPC